MSLIRHMPRCIHGSISKNLLSMGAAVVEQRATSSPTTGQDWPSDCHSAFHVDVGLCPLVAGETDIEQLGRVIATFGSIEAAWPGVTELPDYGKISFAPAEGFPLEELLPDASPGSLHLLKRLLQLNPGRLQQSFHNRSV